MDRSAPNLAPSAEPNPPTEAASRRRRSLTTADKIGLIGLPLTIIGLVVSLLAWLLPQAADPRDAAATGTTTPAGPGVPSADATTAGAGARPAALTFLNTLRPESGGAFLRPLPRDIGDLADYQHVLAIACPTNQTTDQVHNVTYRLAGRYLDLSATVRPYDPAHPDARFWVTALTGTEERDGTITTVEVGHQYGATTTAAQPLTSRLDGATTLTLRVQCETPGGLLILTDAGITRAAS